MTDTIQPNHHRRLAVVDVRPSSPRQLKNNTESRRRQRALDCPVKELVSAGPPILLLEEQQAKTGSSTSQREAYRQLAERVAQAQVGIIFAVEVARWARDNVAWQLLLRDCVFGDVLLADEHRIYDPNDDHDHVYLGIQGVLAEHELRKLRERMLDCWWTKARRGEFFSAIATGYIEVRGQGLRKHPNTRVQNSLDRMFREFRHTPSATRLCQA